MNNLHSFTLLAISLLFTTYLCQAQAVYKGAAKHPQPDRSAIKINQSEYNTNSEITGPLSDSLGLTTAKLMALTKAPGLSVAMLIPGKGLWHLDTGYINKADATKVGTNTVFYWASVGKLITSTIVEQLINEKKFTLNTTLTTWFPGLRDAKTITVDDLLHHTSGIYSFNNDPKEFSLNKYYSPQELIAISQSKKNHFPAGQYWSYSNTNYLLLALIAEKVESKPFAEIVTERIAQPLKLTSLRTLGPDENPHNIALAHTANGEIVNENYSVPLGAGNLVANAKDMVVLLYSLFSDKLGSTDNVYNRLKDLYPMPDNGTYYGSGIMLFDFKAITGTNTIWVGHNGGTETYRALLVYDSATRTFIALSINQHISVEAFARKLLEQINN